MRLWKAETYSDDHWTYGDWHAVPHARAEVPISNRFDRLAIKAMTEAPSHLHILR